MPIFEQAKALLKERSRLALRFRSQGRRIAARAAHLEFGALGEQAALEYLKFCEAYRIVATNFRVQLGRGLANKKITAEIDIIAYDGPTLVFVEVKTRKSGEIAPPEAAVDLKKRRQIARAAIRYRYLMNVVGEPYRYDVVTVISDGRQEQIELLRGYFNDSIFSRGRYFSREHQYR